MSSGAQSFYSSPGFELFRRGLNTQTIKQFRGINVFQGQASLGPEWALDCMNVLVPGWGGLSKFRLPVAMSSAVIGQGVGPQYFTDFQQGNGTRQVISNFGNSLYYMAWDPTGQFLVNATLIETAAADSGPWSMVTANNVLFAANGQVMKKWTGTSWQNWGIAAPAQAPAPGWTVANASLTRAGGTVTVTLPPLTVLRFAAGDQVTIVSPNDPSFGGNFAVLAATDDQHFTYTNAGANAGPVVGATVTANSQFASYTVTANRTNGVTVYALQTTTGIATAFGTGGPTTPIEVIVTGFADATFNGTFIANFVTGSGAGIVVPQPNLPDGVPAGTGTLTSALSAATGVRWAYAYQNSTLGTISNISPPSAVFTGNFRSFQLAAAASPDPQVDTIVWFRTLDGGGDLFLRQSATVANGGLTLLDEGDDNQLNKAVQGPLIHNPPLTGRYLAVGQSRVFVFNLIGAPQDIIYSGYEQILYPGARPEETFPPNNRLRLSIGASAIAGGGVLQSGIVAFSDTDRMYMLRGSVEDITVFAPVQFSAFLEELPWRMGCMSHRSVQATPMGLIWWAADKTVNVFDGTGAPTDISRPVYPLLRRATPGQESQAAGAYFNWLERDWYALSFAIDGAGSNNYTLFWSLSPDTGQIDVFPCSVQMDFVGVLTSSKSQRLLAVSSAGLIRNLPVSQDTVGGIGDQTVIPATAGRLGAFWRGGYFGNDSPVRSKMYKRGLLVADQGGFRVAKRLVDNRTKTFANPLVLGPDKTSGSGEFSIGQRAARVSVEILFPDDDVSCNVMELTVGSIATSDRM